ncbi:MAG: DUF1207 domain-containing protein [Planctomycetes bacterium]|nr:DUF1207 domain-containing protein [Planctomycetota bacterium]
MPASQFPKLALFAVVACSLPTVDLVAFEEATWQPYRETFAVPTSPTVEPAQHLVEAPVFACPPETLLNPQQGQFPGNYCPTPAYPATGPSPIFVNTQFDDPALASLIGPKVWDWKVLPDDVIWHSYWAGAKEPRMSGAVFRDTSGNMSLLDVTFGGRTSLLRYGTTKNNRPEGWELQIEGAGMLRLNLDQNWDFEAVDFRFGVPIVYGHGKFQYKFSYYHLSSHAGDEFLVRNPGFTRINFSRDALVTGVSFFPLPAWRWYAEAGWAFYADEGTEPWEFQFGLDYAQPGPTGSRGTPFLAINGYLREEVDFGGSLVAQAGWLWRGETGHVIRTGLHYYNGKSNQFQFFNQFEQQIGLGLWYDY